MGKENVCRGSAIKIFNEPSAFFKFQNKTLYAYRNGTVNAVDWRG